MIPNHVAPRQRANPADFPALSRGSAAPRFVEAWVTNDAPPAHIGTAAPNAAPRNGAGAGAADRGAGTSVVPANGGTRLPKGFYEMISEGTGAGHAAGAATRSPRGPFGALVSAFASAGAWIWHRSQRSCHDKDGS